MMLRDLLFNEVISFQCINALARHKQEYIFINNSLKTKKVLGKCYHSVHGYRQIFPRSGLPASSLLPKPLSETAELQDTAKQRAIPAKKHC